MDHLAVPGTFRGRLDNLAASNADDKSGMDVKSSNESNDNTTNDSDTEEENGNGKK